MAGPNLLIGNGQVLTGTITRDVSGSSSNIFPYTIERARERLGPGIEQIALALESLPQGAKPKGEGTALVLVHPAYLAKTRMPSDLFRRAGLRTLGSRSAQVIPENDARERAPAGEQPTAELYVAGTSDAFREFLRMLLSDDTGKGVQREFCKLEAVRTLQAEERLLSLSGNDARVALEVVLHGEPGDQVLLDCWRQFKSDHLCQLNFDQGLKTGFVVPGCG